MIKFIKDSNVKAGVFINPATPLVMIEEILAYVDLVLIMTVNPGFGGQSFIYETLPKIKQLYEFRQKNNYNFEIEVDGGVNETNAKLCNDAGADGIVAGREVFNQKDRKKEIEDIRY